MGVAGLRRVGGRKDEAELALLLGERNYNPLRTATYVTLRMLDRAFGEMGFSHVETRVCAEQTWFLDALERMGFSRMEEGDGLIGLAVAKEAFLDRKYLF